MTRAPWMEELPVQVTEAPWAGPTRFVTMGPRLGALVAVVSQLWDDYAPKRSHHKTVRIVTPADSIISRGTLGYLAIAWAKNGDASRAFTYLEQGGVDKDLLLAAWTLLID